jgi:phospholipid/cholesterol/gamma-HCH transport system permease protein
MPTNSETPAARAAERREGEWLLIELGGVWRITESRPVWAGAEGQPPAGIRFRWGQVEEWDSSLLLFLLEVRQWCLASHIPCEIESLPQNVRTLVAQFAAVPEVSVSPRPRETLVATIGGATIEAARSCRSILNFVGQCVLALGRLARRPRKFRWGDWLDEMRQCGAMALPIVSLISFLVGLTLAYQAAEELRRFGADIYVADLVGLSIVREMGPIMAAVILAGRTGAAFAATLGNMQAGEEIDALRTLGISPIDFLVMPRILALALMMPLLALYADAVGIFGGMLISWGELHIPPSAYWIEMQTSLGLTDINAGLIKAFCFGILVALSGCLRGLQAERSAAGVGRAATSAVVTSILLLVVADSIFAVIFEIFQI